MTEVHERGVKRQLAYLAEGHVHSVSHFFAHKQNKADKMIYG